MFQLCSKLKSLKKVLRRLNKEHFSDISERVRAARDNLSRIQHLLQANPSDSGLWKEEVEAVNNYSRLIRAQESFLRQKSRVQWGGPKLKILLQFC